MSARQSLRPYELGFPHTEMRKKLVTAVLKGEKKATASLRSLYEPHTAEPLPQAGEHFFLAGFAGEDLGTIEVTEVTVVALNDVDVAFAIDEGEGYTSIEQWRAAGLRYWSEEGVTDETLIVCGRFRLVSSKPLAAPVRRSHPG